MDISLDWLKAQANSFMAGPANNLTAGPANNLTMPSFEPAFDMPLYGVANGDDPLWLEMKQAVGAFHWTPKEAFDLAYPLNNAAQKDLSIFVWVLPQTKATKHDNRKETQYPSERWSRSRIFGESNINLPLARHLVNTLQAAGLQAVAPVQLPQWHQEPSPVYELASLWSERHAAYIAGLGTFGLSDGLITSAGKAMRVGSVIVRAPFAATPRPYNGIHDYCLYYADGSCQACAKRCPVGSVSTAGRNKAKCKDYLFGPIIPKYVEDNFGFVGYGCGLCQTKVPCESGIPKRLWR